MEGERWRRKVEVNERKEEMLDVGSEVTERPEVGRAVVQEGVRGREGGNG